MVYTQVPQESGMELRHGFDWEFSLQPLKTLPSLREQPFKSNNSSDGLVLAADRADADAQSPEIMSKALRRKSRKLRRPVAWLRHLHGWRKGVFLCCMAAGSILILNTVLVIAAYAHYDKRQGAGALYHGNCDRVRRTSTALHLLINIVSTALLAASSYTMQCLSAPTRLDVDEAHKARKTLAIGIVSIRNMFRIGRRKAVLWCFLSLSTLPLHLLWNSVIVSKIVSNDFLYLVIDNSFLADAAYLEPLSGRYYRVTGRDVDSIRASYHAGNFTRYDIADCISIYGKPFVNKARNLMAVTVPVQGTTRMSPAEGFVDLSSSAANTSVHKLPVLQQPLWNGSSLIAFHYQYGGASSDLRWLCNGYDSFVNDYLHQYCGKKKALQLLKDEGSWSLRPDDYDFDTRDSTEYKVEYCLAEDKIQQQCTLQYIPAFLATVMVCNLIKFICILFAYRLLSSDDEPILATVGDAISSFIERPDNETKGICMLGISNKSVVLNHWKLGNNVPLPYVRSRRRKRLFSATGKRRSCLTFTAGLIYAVIGALLLLLTISIDHNRGVTLSETLSAGLGAADKDHNWSIFTSVDIAATNILANQVIFANVWQVALAVIYFILNSSLTAQAAALEWVTYSQTYQPLRVTFPEGKQKSTWFLQLPFRAAIPLIITLALIHWLISQAIFVLFVEVYGIDGSRESGQDIIGIGYSPVAILCVVCLSGALLSVLVIHGLRPLPCSMPLHGNSSLVISAACHPVSGLAAQEQENGGRISYGLLKWGAIEEDEDLRTDLNVVGHCSFDSHYVFEPVAGKKYM